MSNGGILLPGAGEEDELQLARRLKARDPQALSDAYNLYGRITFAVLLRIVRNAATAEDLVQETFLRVWTRADQIGDTYGVIGPWVITIARNIALDYMKSSAVKLAKRTPISDADMPPVTLDHEIVI